jgi:hypothetical protein
MGGCSGAWIKICVRRSEMREAFESWWSQLSRIEKQAVRVLAAILIGILLFVAGTIIGQAIGAF